MSSSGHAGPVAPVSTPSCSSTTLASGNHRPMTWAERLAGKASSSSSSVSTPSSNSQIPVLGTSNGRPASAAVSASSMTQAGSADAPSNVSNHTTSKANPQNNARKPLNSPSLHDANSTSLPPSISSSTTGTSRFATSTDSGMRDADSSMESNKAESSRGRTPSTSRSSSVRTVETKQTAEVVPDNADKAKSNHSDPSSTHLEMAKASPGPPKVNIWQVRKEEAAKRAAEQAKSKKEQEDLQKQKEPPEASTSKSSGPNMGKNDIGSSEHTDTIKNGKKKRENQNQSAGSSNTLAGTSGNSASKGKNNSSKAMANKQVTRSTSATSKQNIQPVNISQISTAENDPNMPAVTLGQPSDWPSPSEEKHREDAENQTKASPATEESGGGSPEVVQALSDCGSSPSRSKKQTWKSIQPDITFSSPLPSRKSSDSSKAAKGDEHLAKQGGPDSLKSNAASSKAMSTDSSKQPVEALAASNKQTHTALSHELHSATLPSSSAQNGVNTGVPNMASVSVADSARSPPRDKIPMISPSLPSKGNPAKQQSGALSPLPASLPAKPIGAPTGDIPRSRLSPSMHGHSPSTSAVPIRSRQSPATIAQSLPMNNGLPAGGNMHPPLASAHSDIVDSARPPTNGQVKLSPSPHHGMIPPGSPGQPGFHPSVAPMTQFPGRLKRGGLNGNASGRNGGRGGGLGGRVYSHNHSRSQPSGAYGPGLTSPIMGQQTLYHQPPQGYPGHLPPNMHFEQAHIQSQYNPQFDPMAAGVFQHGVPGYYPAPAMYPLPHSLQASTENSYYSVGTPSPQPSSRSPLAQHGRPNQQGFHMMPAAPPSRSTAPSEASHVSQPESPMPVPGLPQGNTQGGAPVFMPAPAGYGTNGAMTPNMSFGSPPPSMHMNTMPAPFPPPQTSHPQMVHAQQNVPQTMLSQMGQSQVASMGSVPPPVYARPSPLCDYSFVMFPPDGTAFWVLGQIEFYFSADNLARDTFLRQSMDEEGWVDIALIASFRRLNSLSQDIHLIRSMMELSFMSEVREMKVRPKEWRSWILPGARKVSWQYP